MSSEHDNVFTEESSERAFSDALQFEDGSGWGMSSVTTVTPCGLATWRVVKHGTALVPKCCWSAAAMSPGLVSWWKHDAGRRDLCSSVQGHLALWSDATMLHCCLGWFPHKPHIRGAPEVRAGNSSSSFRARVGEQGGGDLWSTCCWRLQWVSCSLPTRERVQGRDLLKPTEKSHCYHYITHVGSHLLANLSHIRNEVTLTHPVSRVFQEPSRQRVRFSTVQVCAIWILLLSFPWLKITLPQATPVPEGPCSVLLGTPVEHWQRVKTKSSSRVGDLWRRKQVYLKRAWSLLYFVFQDPYYNLFRIHLYLFPVFCKKKTPRLL